jgi:hypothetical protein
MVNGKIARILDEFTVVLNIGSRHGVKEGQVYLIYEEGEPIPDPDNPSETLGTLEIPKGRVKVTNVQENISLAKSDLWREVRSEPFGSLAVLANLYGHTETKRVPLKVDATNPLKPKSPQVRVGDLVRLIP